MTFAGISASDATTASSILAAAIASVVGVEVDAIEIIAISATTSRRRRLDDSGVVVEFLISAADAAEATSVIASLDGAAADPAIFGSAVVDAAAASDDDGVAALVADVAALAVSARIVTQPPTISPTTAPLPTLTPTLLLESPLIANVSAAVCPATGLSCASRSCAACGSCGSCGARGRVTAVIIGIIIAGFVVLVVDAAAKHLWPASYTYASPAFCRRVVGLELFELGCLVAAALAARNRGESFGAIGFMALTLSAVAVSATVLVWSGFARLPDRPRTDLLLRGAVRRAAEARAISEALALQPTHVPLTLERRLERYNGEQADALAVAATVLWFIAVFDGAELIFVFSRLARFCDTARRFEDVASTVVLLAMVLAGARDVSLAYAPGNTVTPNGPLAASQIALPATATATATAARAAVPALGGRPLGLRAARSVKRAVVSACELSDAAADVLARPECHVRRVSLDIRSGTGNEAWVDARARAACACVAAAYALFEEIVDAAAGSAAPVSVCRVDVVHRAASDVCELLNPLHSKTNHEIVEELRTRTAAVLAVAGALRDASSGGTVRDAVAEARHLLSLSAKPSKETVAARVTSSFWRARREVFERIGGATSVGVDRGAVVDDGIAQFLFLRYHAARLVVPDAGLPVASGGIVDDWASVSGKACAFIDVAISHRGGWGSRGTDSRGGPLFPDVSETDVDVFDRLLARVRTAASDVAEPMWRSDEIEFLRSLASYLETVAGDARVRAPALRREDSGTAPDNAVQATAVNKPARVAKSYLRAARHAFVVTAREQLAWLLIMSISIIAFGRCAVTLGPRHAALDARTFLGVPSHYDLARRRNQRVLIPLVYGIMHSALNVFAWLPFYFCRCTHRWLQRITPAAANALHLDRPRDMHVALGYLLYAHILFGALLWWVAVAAPCAGAGDRACNGLHPCGSFFDTRPLPPNGRFRRAASTVFGGGTDFAPGNAGAVFFLRIIVVTMMLVSLVASELVLPIFGGLGWQPTAAFEIFRYTHVACMTVIVVGALYSRYEVFYPAAPTWAWYALDVIWLRLTGHYVADAAQIEYFSATGSAAFKLRLPKAMQRRWGRRATFAHRAAQVVYVKVPDVSSHEWHPFSIASAPQDEFLELIVKCQGPNSWTRRVPASYEAVHRAKRPWTVEILGPVGSAFGDLRHETNVLVIGAGAGLPSSLSVLKQVAHDMLVPAASRRLERLTFVWVTRSVEDLLWCWDDLKGVLARLGDASAWLTLCIRITKCERGAQEKLDVLLTEPGVGQILHNALALGSVRGPRLWRETFAVAVQECKAPGRVQACYCGPVALKNVIQAATRSIVHSPKPGVVVAFSCECAYASPARVRAPPYNSKVRPALEPTSSVDQLLERTPSWKLRIAMRLAGDPYRVELAPAPAPSFTGEQPRRPVREAPAPPGPA